MKTTVNGYPINKNGKPITQLTDEVVRAEFQGEVIKQNGTYLYFRFKRKGMYIYSE